MQFKTLTSFFVVILVFSCSNPSEQNKEFRTAQYDENNEDNKLEPGIDSTFLLGEWIIEDASRSVLEYPYVGGMPESFWIHDLSQIRRGLLVADSNNARYPFMVNSVDFDSLILRLHPGACLCEGVEARYGKIANH